jgi:hypothetical protein
MDILDVQGVSAREIYVADHRADCREYGWKVRYFHDFSGKSRAVRCAALFL